LFVWEFHYQTNTISKYSDFPAYGLKKEICEKCKTQDKWKVSFNNFSITFMGFYLF